MAVLSWGKPKIEFAPITNDIIGTYVISDTPKQDSSQLTTEEGNKTEAQEEGGGVVDSRRDKNKYSFVFELFAKKGTTQPIPDTDGVVAGNYAIRLTPEDPTIPGWQMEKCAVSMVKTWNSSDGELWRYTFEGLVPATGNILKPYTV